MVFDPITLLAILLMALATYATRAGGLWLASRFDLSERAGAWLEQIPGAILISLVAPTVLTGGSPRCSRPSPSCSSPSAPAACRRPW